MASPQEIEETLLLIRKAWEEAPMLRLGQLLTNAAAIVTWTNKDLFYIENGQLNNGLKKFIKEVKTL